MGLTAIEPRVNADIVEELEDMLSRARTGEVTGLTFVAELTGARIRSYHTSKDSVMVLGHLTRMVACTNTALDDAITASVGGK